MAQDIVSINSSEWSEWKETLVNYPTLMVEVMEMMMMMPKRKISDADDSIIGKKKARPNRSEALNKPFLSKLKILFTI